MQKKKGRRKSACTNIFECHTEPWAQENGACQKNLGTLKIAEDKQLGDYGRREFFPERISSLV